MMKTQEVRPGSDLSPSSYLQDFTRRETTLPGYRLGWFQAIRKTAIRRFAALGFPTDQDLDWQYTSVRPITAIPFTPMDGLDVTGVTTDRLANAAFRATVACQLVFVNGYYAPELSSKAPPPPGVRVGNLAGLLATDPRVLEPSLGRYAETQRHAFTALNTALFADGAFVQIARGTSLDLPIHLLFISMSTENPLISHPRVMLLAERDTKASVIESYVGGGGHKAIPYFTNAVTEVVVGENARIDHYRLQRESETAFHIARLQVRQDRASVFTSHVLSFGGSLARTDVNVTLNAEGAECTLNGLYVVSGRQHVDHHTIIDHVKPHSSSRELYKGVLDGEARAVFNGSIIVRPDAQKTDAMQTNKNLLLSNDAVIHTKPELQIFANDVKCKHGATIGQISADALFYLRSRGISQEAARRLLIYAFVSDMLDRIGVESLRTGVAAWLSSRLPTEPEAPR